MREVLRYARFIVLFFVLSICLMVPRAFASPPPPPITHIDQWYIQWLDEASQEPVLADVMDQEHNDRWIWSTGNDRVTTKPEGFNSAWIKIEVPDLKWENPGIMLDVNFAQQIRIFNDGYLIYEDERNYGYETNNILLKLSPHYYNKPIYIYLKGNADASSLGIDGSVKLGDFQSMNSKYLQKNILDIILGGTLVFVSISLLICMLFVNKIYWPGWNSLCLLMLSLGVMTLTISPYLYAFFGKSSRVYYYLFDISSTFIMTWIFLFFEQIIGKGTSRILKYGLRVQLVISIGSSVWLLLSILLGGGILHYYESIVPLIFASSVMIGNIILISVLALYCMKRNRESIIISTGFALFALTVVSELVIYFTHKDYEMFYWKWGTLFFIFSLIVVLIRRIINNYEQMLLYSRKLEVFNNELQRSEKMEIISQLAASVAHEVRNPLQVTRGFLQLIGHRSADQKDKNYMLLAIDELDRASSIITDFLTFAKPQVEMTTILNIAEELGQIEAILSPLATIQGGELRVESNFELYVRGNSSKFKQAIINIVKNSIEALPTKGSIDIIAYQEDSTVIIRISDNGVGMEESELERLGEPYFSNKSKGTGLGLMVTFRIIEVMNGRIYFNSIKGVGTEAFVSLPIAEIQ